MNIERAWQSLDKYALAVTAWQAMPSPLFATVSGAHLYGFESPDSDVDLRGAFLRPVKETLGLKQPKETITKSDGGPPELDIVAHSARKFASLMVKGSGDILEQLYSPLVVVTGPEHDELKELGKGFITQRLGRNAVGIDKSPEAIRTASERLERGR